MTSAARQGARRDLRAGDSHTTRAATTREGEGGRVDPHGLIAIRRTALIRALLASAAVLGLASAAVQVSTHLLGHGRVFGLVTTFDMTREGNLPTWFSVVLLLGCGCVTGLIWAATRERHDPDARYWALLAMLFAAASADEAAELHETLGRAVTDGGHVYWYMVPGTLLLLGIAFAMRCFFKRLPQSTRRALGWGIVTWTFGAIGLEGLEALYRSGEGVERSFGPSLLNTFQDVFEVLGLIIILDALIRHAGERGYRTTVGFAR